MIYLFFRRVWDEESGAGNQAVKAVCIFITRCFMVKSSSWQQKIYKSISIKSIKSIIALHETAWFTRENNNVSTDARFLPKWHKMLRFLLLNTAALQTEAAPAPGESMLRLQMMTYWIINAAFKPSHFTADAMGCLLVFYFSWWIFPISPCSAGIHAVINNHCNTFIVRLWCDVVVKLITPGVKTLFRWMLEYFVQTYFGPQRMS